MSDSQITFLILGLIAIVAIFVIIVIISDYKNNPFSYPIIKYEIDLSKRRKPSYQDCIDQWLIDHQDIDLSNAYENEIAAWENSCEAYLGKTWLWKKHKSELYDTLYEEVTSPDYPLFKFVFIRYQTRYRQQNYQKTSYTVKSTENIEMYSLQKLITIQNKLSDINFETTREKYHAKNQRKLMTRELREKIMKRDNYTCQICGKYMPDEVGLQVDHIVPIKKGGKSVESNLQVLCDKCNRQKSSK